MYTDKELKRITPLITILIRNYTLKRIDFKFEESINNIIPSAVVNNIFYDMIWTDNNLIIKRYVNYFRRPNDGWVIPINELPSDFNSFMMYHYLRSICACKKKQPILEPIFQVEL